jgi:DNA polymerase-3 subunit alpha
VLSVGTYSTVGLKSGLKDILRKEQIDFKTSNEFVNCFDDELSWTENIEKLKNNQSMYAIYQAHKKSIDMTPKIMNKIRQAGKHAGGVIILPDAVYNYFPVMRIANQDEIVSAFVESNQSSELDDIGCVKLDLLAITILDVFDATIDLITEDLYEIIEDGVKKIVPESYISNIL